MPNRNNGEVARLLKEGTIHRILLSAALVGALSPACAQTYTYAQQRRACGGDVMRLCWRYVPSRAAITGCMLRSRARLSPGCATVFDAGMRQLAR